MLEPNHHRLLARQMKRFGINEIDNPDLKTFLDSVNKTYNQFEKEKNIQDNYSSKLIQKISQANVNLTNIIETIDSFNYHVSHDLKTVIINNISLAKMGTKYYEKDHKNKLELVLEKLQTNSNTGLKVIEKYLAISKFETKAKESETKMRNLREQINCVLNETNLETDLKVRIEKEDFSEILMDGVSIHSLLHNIITNAFKYKKEDTVPELIFNFESIDGYNCIIAQDNGIGIDLKKHKDKIFKPFVRIDNTEIEGSGVGLFIVKKIVTQLSGTIEVKSALGEGTTFIVKLPK
jgi:signal transduction histidine kinase